jgi:hypothetical protein
LLFVKDKYQVVDQEQEPVETEVSEASEDICNENEVQNPTIAEESGDSTAIESQISSESSESSVLTAKLQGVSKTKTECEVSIIR